LTNKIGGDEIILKQKNKRMKSKVAERILAKTPEAVTIFVKCYANLLVKINSLLKNKG
jgi:hypothetical protein